MSYSPYGKYANSTVAEPVDTYAGLVAKVEALYSYVEGLEALKANQVSFGEILTKLNDVCVKLNQHTTILSDLQQRVYALEANASTIVSVIKL